MPKSKSRVERLTVAMIAAQNGIPRRTIQNAIKNGQLRAKKIGDNTTPYVCSPADVHAWLTRRNATTRSAINRENRRRRAC